MKQPSKSTISFYQWDKLISLKQDDKLYSIFRNINIPLAERRTGETLETGILLHDTKASILGILEINRQRTHSYTAYGYAPSVPSPSTFLSFNGDRLDACTQCYLLGNGYRAYSPTLMRFHSSDSLSPFGSGGLNSYMYVGGDPINRLDPSGHIGILSVFKKPWRAVFGKYQKFSGRARNVDGIATYMSKHPTKKGEMAITAVTHGDERGLDAHGKVMTASDYLSAAKSAGFDISAYDMHFIACSTAGPTVQADPTFIEQTQRITGRNAYGYFDEVFTVDSVDFEKPIENNTKVSSYVSQKDRIYMKTKNYQYHRFVADAKGIRRIEGN